MNTTNRDKEQLCELVKEKLGGRRLVVVSNREPYEHSISGDTIYCNRPVGGLTEALDPVMRAVGGCWVAYGSGAADRQTVDTSDCVAVPPESPEYELRRVWLTEEEVHGYYLGFANETLWPLCHIAFVPPVYHQDYWETYRSVNRKFANAVLEQIAGRDALVLIQDYHLALVAKMLREDCPELTIGQFWHIPWPPHEVFRTCPWREAILEGLLGNDLLGFHVPRFCDNFLGSVQCLSGSETDPAARSIIYRGRQIQVRAVPISVDYQVISSSAAAEDVRIEMSRLRQQYSLEGKFIGTGMDRMDYTKGIPERLLAYELFLKENPEYHGRVVFIQAGMPSRSQIGTYQKLGNRIEWLINSINETFGTGDWQPVITLTGQLMYSTLNALRQLADFCVVSSVDDGMNLVCKEYVAARNDDDGVLILSEFTGAATEMKDALMINPYDTRSFAAMMKTALEMPEEERHRRMACLRSAVKSHTIYHWASELLTRLIDIREGR